MFAAPDFAAPIVAWRSWRVVERPDGLRLASVVQPTVWEPRRELHCECLAHPPRLRLLRRRDRDEHRAPGERCECGIYAARRAELAGMYAVAGPADGPEVVARVIGLVSLWGRVLACKRGWRAEVAYPARIFVPRRDEHEDRRRAEELAFALTDYGVPIEIVAHRGERDLARSLTLLRSAAAR